jgi:hypothetical protein
VHFETAVELPTPMEFVGYIPTNSIDVATLMEFPTDTVTNSIGVGCAGGAKSRPPCLHCAVKPEGAEGRPPNQCFTAKAHAPRWRRNYFQ